MNPSLFRTPSASARVAKPERYRRRAERRVAHRVPCRVRAARTSNGKTLCVVGQTVNLSANGLAVQLGRLVDDGTPVEILLPHLDGEPTRLWGRVVHSRRVLTGTFEVGIWIEPEIVS